MVLEGHPSLLFQMVWREPSVEETARKQKSRMLGLKTKIFDYSYSHWNWPEPSRPEVYYIFEGILLLRKPKWKVKVAQLCLTLQFHGILQARILEWVAYPFSSGSSRPRNQTRVSCIAGGFFTNRAIRETHETKPSLKNPVIAQPSEHFLGPWTLHKQEVNWWWWISQEASALSYPALSLGAASQ